MENTYLKIELEETIKPKDQVFFKTLLWEFLSTIFPKANPDFENQIQNINIWLIEFDVNGIPEREIGLDKDEKVVMIMPWKDNYGYWTDTNFNLKDFKNGFNYLQIAEAYFENAWNQFESNNC